MAYRNLRMFVKSVIVWCVCLAGYSSTAAGPTKISVAEKAPNYPNVQVMLMSIDDKLRSLEDTISVQCTTAIGGKIDYYSRKIDNIERDFARFQVFVRMEMDKISENISNRNFKDEFARDHLVRKMDSVYERINHKLDSMEEQIEITNVKSQNAREMVITKLEKMEDSLTIRDADMEAELADAVAAIDDLKGTCGNMEENIINITKETTKNIISSTEKCAKKQSSQIVNLMEPMNKSLSEKLQSLQADLEVLLNQTIENLDAIRNAKDNVDGNLNEYANKITNMNSDLWKKTDYIESTVRDLAKVTNLTRNEQQNGLRALMVQVGRKSGKSSVQCDSSLKMQELSDKIDSNFERVLMTQNLFIESCHRVQMDESQLETHISSILNKLLDMFDNKATISTQDFEQLAQMIRMHDSNIRRSIYHITNNLLALMQKTTTGKDEIIDYINTQWMQIDALFDLLQIGIYKSNHSEQVQYAILEILQGFQNQLNKTYYQTNVVLSQIDVMNNFVNKILNTSEEDNEKLRHMLEFIHNIYDILRGIEIKLNKHKAHLSNKNITEYTTESNATKETNISEQNVEMKFFTDDASNNSIYATKLNTSFASNLPEDEIEEIIILCEESNSSLNCGNITNTKYAIITESENKDKMDNTEFVTNSGSSNCSLNNTDSIDCTETEMITDIEHSTRSYEYATDITSTKITDTTSNYFINSQHTEARFDSTTKVSIEKTTAPFSTDITSEDINYVTNEFTEKTTEYTNHEFH